jgi:uncharacterized protein YjaZ
LTFGESSMPAVTGRPIGHQIVAAYLALNKGASWAALAATPAKEIFRNSGYAPGP